MRVVNEHRRGIASLGLSQVLGPKSQAVIDKGPPRRQLAACEFYGEARLPEASSRRGRSPAVSPAAELAVDRQAERVAVEGAAALQVDRMQQQPAAEYLHRAHAGN
jgi:hypothetical protein